MKSLKNFISVNKKFILQKNNFIYFLALGLFFISSSAMAMSTGSSIAQQLNSSTVYGSKSFPPLPVLGTNTEHLVLSAQGVYALDIDSGVTLYQKNADAPLLPASTTKIITALVGIESFRMDSILTVGRRANVPGQKMGLYVGETIRFEDLLYGLLVYSANDAAETIAENYSGGYDAFITAMNDKAAELSMDNTHFDNPIGLDGNSQRSTARDLVRASEVAMRDPVFAKIVGTKDVVVHDATGIRTYNLKNINSLLGVVPGVIGIKTGWTESARENLVTYITRDNHRVVIALLGSQDRFGETKELIDWIFTNYNWQEVSSK